MDLGPQSDKKASSSKNCESVLQVIECELEWTQSKNDPGLFYKTVEGQKIFMHVYVDDGLLIGPSRLIEAERKRVLTRFKGRLVNPEQKEGFRQLDYLGIIIAKYEGRVVTHQQPMVQKVLEMFKAEGTAKSPIATPLQNEGGSDNRFSYDCGGTFSIYLMHTRPDVAFSIKEFSRFLDSPQKSCYEAVERVLQYLQGTVNYGLEYRHDDNILVGYSDADFANEFPGRKPGTLLLLGRSPISFKSVSQKLVALSTCESEYIALFQLFKEVTYVIRLYEEVFGKKLAPINIKVDNTSTLKVADEKIVTGRTKHMDLRLNFIREKIDDGLITLEYCESEKNYADIFTKPLDVNKFQTQQRRVVKQF